MKNFPVIALTLLLGGGCAVAETVTPESTEGPPPPPPVPVNEVFEDSSRRTCEDLKETMLVIKTTSTNNFGNPIWKIVTPECKPYKAVIGRANTQNLNRHESGNESPLPPGVYNIGRSHEVSGEGFHPELGGKTFIDLHPMFYTQRSDLGIHWDPSFNTDKEKDGTAACVALTNPDDLDAIQDVIERYRIKYLVVVS